jgi:signal transduction histidine kinase
VVRPGPFEELHGVGERAALPAQDCNLRQRPRKLILKVGDLREQVRLETDLGPLPPVLCYPAKINQVVLNLLVNAIDACPAGATVMVRSCATADGVAVHVVDTGPGIEKAVLPRIFDPFFTTKRPGQGTGLGLSISHGIVADHGGRIEVESTPGRGAHFTVYLPRTPPPAQAGGKA